MAWAKPIRRSCTVPRGRGLWACDRRPCVCPACRLLRISRETTWDLSVARRHARAYGPLRLARADRLETNVDIVPLPLCVPQPGHRAGPQLIATSAQGFSSPDLFKRMPEILRPIPWVGSRQSRSIDWMRTGVPPMCMETRSASRSTFTRTHSPGLSNSRLFSPWRFYRGRWGYP